MNTVNQPRNSEPNTAMLATVTAAMPKNGPTSSSTRLPYWSVLAPMIGEKINSTA